MTSFLEWKRSTGWRLLHGQAADAAGNEPAERRAEIEGQLLAYCELDTLALVRLWEWFRGRV